MIKKKNNKRFFPKKNKKPKNNTDNTDTNNTDTTNTNTNNAKKNKYTKNNKKNKNNNTNKNKNTNKKRKIDLFVPYVQKFSPEDSLFEEEKFNEDIEKFIEKKINIRSGNLIQTHEVKFIEWNPSAINMMAVNSTEELLAVARSDSSIEIRNIEDTKLYKFIPAIQDKSVGRVQAMTWINTQINGKSKELLLTAGLNGFVTSWDISTLKEIQNCNSFGGPIWCMKPNSDGSLISLGCEDGTVRIFEMIEGELIYKSFLKSNNIGGKKKIIYQPFFWENQFYLILPYLFNQYSRQKKYHQKNHHKKISPQKKYPNEFFFFF